MSVMSQLDLVRITDPRCGNCGQQESQSGIPVTTIVVDWRAEMLCDRCVASHDWQDWNFDPITNIYTRA